jgi:hypothetical protein
MSALCGKNRDMTAEMLKRQKRGIVSIACVSISIVTAAAGKSAFYPTISRHAYAKGVVRLFAENADCAVFRLPPLRTSPPKNLPAEKEIVLSFGRLYAQITRKEEHFMKQTVQKKPKVFRTLIRLIRNDGKETLNNSDRQSAGKKNNRGRQPPFFFGG